MANFFLDHWIISFGILVYFPTYNGPHFFSSFTAFVCDYLENTPVTSTAYHPQTSDPGEQLNRTIKGPLRSDFSDHQRN